MTLDVDGRARRGAEDRRRDEPLARAGRRRHPLDRQREHGRRAAARLACSAATTRATSRSSPSAAPGPLHANAVAKLMGSYPVIVPPSPGLLCAIGDLVADFRNEFARRSSASCARRRRTRSPTSSRSSAAARATGWTRRASRRPTSASATSPTCATTARATRSRSRSTRRRRATASASSRSASTRCTSSSTASACTPRRARSSTCARSATARCRSPSCRPERAPDPAGAVVEEHAILFEGENVPTRIYDRPKLQPGSAHPGPGGRHGVRLDHGGAARLPGRGRHPLQPPDQPRGVSMAATEELRIAAIPTDVEIDPVTLDIIEGALKSARYEMDAVLFRSAMSPVIREQHDEFPMLTDPRGRMVVGQFGAYINEMMADWTRGIYPGDVILCADPFKCSRLDQPHERLARARADLLRGRARRLGVAVRPHDGRRRPAAGRAADGREDDLRARASSSRRSRSSSAASCRRTCSG